MLKQAFEQSEKTFGGILPIRQVLAQNQKLNHGLHALVAAAPSDGKLFVRVEATPTP